MRACLWLEASEAWSTRSSSDPSLLFAQFRPTADIKNVLLHEMIHAYNFLVGPRDDGRDGEVQDLGALNARTPL